MLLYKKKQFQKLFIDQLDRSKAKCPFKVSSRVEIKQVHIKPHQEVIQGSELK